jgi:hypothetical protein
MTIAAARIWIVKASLTITGSSLLFYLVAPAAKSSVLYYPLKYSQSPRILQIVLPVFLGYLGSATAFMFRGQGRDLGEGDELGELGSLLVRGPIIIFGLALIGVNIAFWVSNRPESSIGSGMTLEQLAGGVTAILGLLTATTGVCVTHLFSPRRRN